MVGWLVVWLAGWLAGWLVGWAGWLVGSPLGFHSYQTDVICLMIGWLDVCLVG